MASVRPFAALLTVASLFVACEPVGPVDPMDVVAPGGADDPPEAQEVACAPEFTWRRPGGGGLMGGHDADWRIVPGGPDGWNDEGTTEWVIRDDECGRVVASTVWYGCGNFDGCEGWTATEATYDAAGRLVSEATGEQTFVLALNDGWIQLSHQYDARGARVATFATDTHDQPQVAYSEVRRFQNDATGRVIAEEVRRLQDNWDQVGVVIRRSTFVYDEVTGEVTEHVDEGADGRVDHVLVW